MKNAILLLCSFFLFIGPDWAEEKKDSVQVREIEPFWYCCVEMTGSYEQHNNAFQTLYEQAGAQSLGMDFVAFGIYYNSPEQVQESELKWEIGFELAEKTDVKAPLVLKEWKYTTMAVIPYEGSFSSEAFGLAYQKLFEWVGQNNYVVAGPAMEKYTSMPAQNSDGEWEGTLDMMLPVQKKSCCYKPFYLSSCIFFVIDPLSVESR